MALRVGRTHYVPFRVGTVAAPITGLNLVSFVIVFTRDNVNITGASQALAVVSNGTGQYCATYTPTAAGFYHLELYNIANTTLITDNVEIDTPQTAADVDDFVALTQDFGGVGALKPTVDNADAFTLMVFLSQDWQVGKTDNSFAIQMTPLDTNGNWLTTPLSVNHSTYHIVIKDTVGDVVVIRPFLVT